MGRRGEQKQKVPIQFWLEPEKKKLADLLITENYAKSLREIFELGLVVLEQQTKGFGKRV